MPALKGVRCLGLSEGTEGPQGDITSSVLASARSGLWGGEVRGWVGGLQAAPGRALTAQIPGVTTFQHHLMSDNGR